MITSEKPASPQPVVPDGPGELVPSLGSFFGASLRAWGQKQIRTLRLPQGFIMETVWGCYSELPALFPPPTATRAGGPGLVCRGRSYGRGGGLGQSAIDDLDRGGDRTKKLFQFLNEIGTIALSRHLGRVQEIAEDSADKWEYQARIAKRFGFEQQLELPIPLPEPTPKEAAH
jgi:hypothetical protein